MKTLVENLAGFDVPGRDHHSPLAGDLPNCPGQTLLSIEMMLVTVVLLMTMMMMMMMMMVAYTQNSYGGFSYS